MKIFQEKANAEVMKECEGFIQKHSTTTGDYYTFRESLALYLKLAQTLIDSQKDFDNAIRQETDKIIKMEEGIEKERNIIIFNQSNYSLRLDQDAHKVLEELEKIQRNNCKKSL